MENLHKKIKANAASSYLLIGINWAFLLNRDNEYINHSFVKVHTKTALLIHLGFVLNIVIFVWNNPLTILPILGYNLGDIIAVIIFLGLASTLFMGFYKAKSGQQFYIKDIVQTSSDKKLLDINGDLKINERDKLTLILSHVPFIGAYLYGKYSNYKVVQTIGKLNLYATTLILLLYIGGKQNLANLISLFYIIYIAFSALNLFMSQKLIQINLDNYPTPKDVRISAITAISYLRNYFSKQKFVNYNELKGNIADASSKNDKALEQKLKSLPSNKKLEKYSIYTHNFSIILILSFIILVTNINNLWLLIILLISTYTLGYVKYSLSYKTPFIHDIYAFSRSRYNEIKNFFIKTKKLHQKEEVKTIKVAEK